MEVARGFGGIAILWHKRIGAIPVSIIATKYKKIANFNASDSIAWDKVTTEDVENFHRAILNGLLDISSDVLDCCNAECISHTSTIDFYCNQFLSSLSSSASLCLPKKSKCRKVVPGWNDHVQQFCCVLEQAVE